MRPSGTAMWIIGSSIDHTHCITCGRKIGESNSGAITNVTRIINIDISLSYIITIHIISCFRTRTVIITTINIIRTTIEVDVADRVVIV